MQYALVNSHRAVATKGTSGICELCNKMVIAKCGTVKIHHWAHQKIRDCDHWWEPETSWHRDWKNLFPEEFREKPFRDKMTGEPHRADLHTDKNITVEFQYSHIEPHEQSSRENFYPNLVWVVNGMRLKRDYPRFVKNVKRFHYLSPGIFRLDYPEECFPQAWVSRPVPVIFDFIGQLTTEGVQDEESLYCLLPKRLGEYAIGSKISRSDFVKAVTEGYWTAWTAKVVGEIEKVAQAAQAQRQREENMRLNILMRNIPNRRHRRF